MLSKKEIKDIQSLSHKKFRKALKLFIAEGPKIVEELWQLMPIQFEKIYATREWIDAAPEACRKIAIEISQQELGKISTLSSPNQVLALIRKFENRAPDDVSLVLYLDQVQDPGNFGTIIRIADWFNIRQVVCRSGCADLYNPKVIQSTMASLARVQVYYDEGDQWIHHQKLPVYAATLDGVSVYEHPKISEGIIVIGNESKGISAEVLARATQKITIPRKGNAESLNAAVATGILLSHLVGEQLRGVENS